MTPFVPPKTAEKINGAHPEGTRHKAAMDIAVSLVGNGMAPTAVYAQLRQTFPADLSDNELEGVVRWAEKANPAPSNLNGPARTFTPFRAQRAEPQKHRSPVEHTSWWLSGVEEDGDKLSASSRVPIPAEPLHSAFLFFTTLYLPTEYLNIVTKFKVEEKGGKANPNGGGKTLLREEWLEWFAEKGMPQSDAGAWLRMNPCKAVGSGHEGAITETDITAFRFLLVESDVLPLAVQIAFYSRVPLPITAIFSSGGKSVHAWVRIDAPDLASYKESVARILSALAPFGFDESNKNASRLSRLPGVVRKIGGSNGGLQKLLWMNPAAQPLDHFGLTAFEDALKLPALEEKPFRAIIDAAISRYDELIKNRGRNGVMTGLDSFDKESGGLKKGQMTVISAPTNGGKSTVAINFINVALTAGRRVALFTMEMDRQEICDLLVAMNGRVNRNFFNNGEFTEESMESIKRWHGWLAKLPFWVEDPPVMTAAMIRARTLQLVRDKQIDLAVIDYIQFISSENQNEPREQQIAGISRALRSLAKEANIPIIVLSQLNDEGKLRESRVIGHDAHIVAMVQDLEENPVFRVIKGRSIPKNKHPFKYDPTYCLISNPKKIEQSDLPNYDH